MTPLIYDIFVIKILFNANIITQTRHVHQLTIKRNIPP